MLNVVVGLFVSCIFFITNLSFGADNTIKLDGYITNDNKEEYFEDLCVGIGRAISPPPMNIGIPLGIGMGFGLGTEFVDIDNDNAYWRLATRSGEPDDFLVIPRIYFVKGLPLNFDVGLSYLQAEDSNIKAAGLDVKWTILEGSPVAPVLNLRGNLGWMFETKDFDLYVLGADIWLIRDYARFKPFLGFGAILGIPNSAVKPKNDTVTDSLIFTGIKLNLGRLGVVMGIKIYGITNFDLKMLKLSNYNIEINYTI